MAPAAPVHEHDVLVLADRIHTLADDQPARAMLVRGGRVAAVGTPDSVGAPADVRVVDLAGCTVTPGLTDAHIHLTEWALARRQADLAGAGSPAEAVARLQAHHAAERDRESWVRGQGWNAHLWHGAAPHRSLLDQAFPSRPVALQSQDLHALWVNSAALELAGIGADTPDPADGRIVRDEQGVPTGLLLEWAARMVTDRIPVPSAGTVLDAVLDAQAALHASGITGVHSFPGIHIREPDPFTIVQMIRERGALRLRVLQHVPLDALDAAMRLHLRSGFGDEWIRFGAVKMFLDGSLGSRTAWMRERYLDADTRGVSVLEPDVFEDAVSRAAEAGIATTVHAIGDAAADLALDVLADAAYRVPALPHRIEHLQCCPVERTGDAARAGIVCSVQPSHLISDWAAADRCWGPERNKGVFALRALLDAGTILAFGSDAPVEPVDPRRGLHAAVLRTDLERAPPGGWNPQECITPREALRGYTTGPAYAAGAGHLAGVLAPGAAADFVAWDADPLGDPDRLLEMRCIATAVAGQFVHQD